MILKYCTITGPDDAVKPLELRKLSEKFPFVEWAIPYSPEDRGTPRYPTAEWIAQFHKACPNVHKSTHLCKQGLTDFINGEHTALQHVARFPRIQLNFGFGFNLGKVNETILVSRITAMHDKEFIFQYNDQTKHLFSPLGNLPNVAVLFDASAGRGERPTTWPNSFPEHFCGRAGGIGPDNIGSVLDALISNIPPQQETWLDMETRVRTDDNRLDLIHRVPSVLETVQLYGARPGLLLRPLQHILKS